MPPLLVPYVEYTDPWNQSLTERLAMLGCSSRRIAYFYEAANNSTFRYRAYNMAQVLNANPAGNVSASYFYRSDYAQFDEIADLADTLVICRSRYNAELSQLVTKFKARGRRVLFDVDDLVFDPAYTHLVMNTLGLNSYDDQMWDQWFAYLARMGATARLCDGAITTNTFLAERLSAYAGVHTAVVPNFLNQEQMAMSDQVYDARAASGFKRGSTVTLGYFSGSPSHRLDYAIVESALGNLMKRRENIELVVVGYIDPTPALAAVSARVHKAPFHDYVNLQALIGSVDFNIMPLQSNTFTDCKSELKYFDAAAVGTVSIASPSYTYERAIKHGVNGYLARAHEWETMVACAIDSEDSYALLASNGRASVAEKYTWKTQYPAIVKALNQC